MSTPNFMKDLTDLSNDIVQSDNKEEVMKEGLEKINQYLPSSIYIPFVNSKFREKKLISHFLDSMRNYSVLNIVTSESRLFLTKERAPFMICLEVFRPEELQHHMQEQ
jgi:hypothetical protein